MSINSEGQPWPQTLTHEDLEWPSSEQRVLVPFHEAVNRAETGALGGSVAFGSDGELYLLHAVDSADVASSESVREQSELQLDVRDEFDVPVTDVVEEFSPDVLDSFVDAYSITTAVIDEDQDVFTSRDGSARTKRCHTLVGTGMDAFESPSSILVPVASGPHSGLATKIAQSIARAYDCWIELFHVVPEDASQETETDARDLLAAYEHRLDDDVEVDRHVYEATDPADAIVEHSEYHSVTILGAPRKGKLRRFVFGSTVDDVKRNVGRGPVLTARRNGTGSALSRWL